MRSLVSVLVFSWLATAALGQDATPNHVFQTTETIRLQLAAYNQANFSNPGTEARVEASILPRHVFQLAERVLEEV